MLKEEFEQRRTRKGLREMLSAVEEHVDKLEGSMENVKEALDGFEGHINNWKEQSRDYVKMSLNSTMDKVNELFDSHKDKLSDRNDALEAMLIALKEETIATTLALSTRIEELEGEPALCRAAVGEGVSSAALSNKYVPKPKEFVGTRSACDVENLLWRMENYFRAKGIMDDAGKVELQIKGNVRLEHGKVPTRVERTVLPGFFEKETWEKLQGITQRGTVGECVREFKKLMLQVSDVTEREAMLAFQEGLKPWVRQEVEQRGVQKLSEAMTVAVSVVKLGLGKDKLGSSKSEKKGVCEGNHKEDTDEYGNGNGNNGGNGKPRVGKKKPKRKRDKLKCFLCDCPHILKKCPMKSALRKKPVGKALGLGSRARGVEAKEAESEKKPIECFLCHGPHRLRKCLRKPIIDGNDRADTEPKKLGSSKGKAKAKRAKRSKSVIERNDGADKESKKLGSSKGKATSEHSESSEGLPPKEVVSLSSNLKEEVAMKTVKMGPMRLESSEASELAKSSTRLSPMGEVSGASDFKEKEVMHVGQLTRVNVKMYKRVGRLELRSYGSRGKSPEGREETRTLREWVGENVKGQSSKPVTIEPNTSDGGLLLRWGSFSPRELAQFKELLEKSVKLKHGWPDSEDMAT
ncbi:hypothetical protein PVK06_004264 [Gossypium arboreum]|uniref:Retrotransposon gag domain-containing protein n=1 Tax=Gossypium arboreum TaxID=29729 RepID=A0ABR0QSK4_GOSAR|nr:hypothetical protein PVK06_004264 [Gossypium arboreum]